MFLSGLLVKNLCIMGSKVEIHCLPHFPDIRASLVYVEMGIYGYSGYSGRG